MLLQPARKARAQRPQGGFHTDEDVFKAISSRIVFDTNVLFLAFIAHGVCAGLYEECLQRAQIVVSPDILREFHEKLLTKAGLTITAIVHEIPRENMTSYDWPHHFKQLHEKAVALYREGRRDPHEYFVASEVKFLRGIGCSGLELYDFAEDWCGRGEPDFETALLITAARRDYFLTIQKRKPSRKIEPSDTLPAPAVKLGGIEWLPRLIEKAKRKLHGTMSGDVMYCCGGDRRFLKKHRIHPADFLRVVWSAHDDDAKILAYVRMQAPG